MAGPRFALGPRADSLSIGETYRGAFVRARHGTPAGISVCFGQNPHHLQSGGPQTPAAAGLPLLVTRLYGVEELLVHGMNGFELPRDPEGIAEMLARFLWLTPAERLEMGTVSRRRAESYSVERFAGNWRSFYRQIARSQQHMHLEAMHHDAN